MNTVKKAIAVANMTIEAGEMATVAGNGTLYYAGDGDSADGASAFMTPRI